jgi:hypothetical protein
MQRVQDHQHREVQHTRAEHVADSAAHTANCNP